MKVNLKRLISRTFKFCVMMSIIGTFQDLAILAFKEDEYTYCIICTLIVVPFWYRIYEVYIESE